MGFNPTKENMLRPRPCRTCGQMMSRDFLEKKEKLKGERVSAAAKAARENGEKFGRPSTVDPDEAYKLRSKGLLLTEIAQTLNCSKSSVQRALRRFK